ncbi:hypothetical protein EV356DRAFT_508273 [Viridothelium virens]|uniref:Uncharacterized protein n=1 Tax=Viridothelium virens TaxID=1048519 RepID=A0A6A6GYH6_VIRVR|nr:hypothetical protein EV356DRAFT_508273 [Viridothelium virens]
MPVPISEVKRIEQGQSQWGCGMYNKPCCGQRVALAINRISSKNASHEFTGQLIERGQRVRKSHCIALLDP